MPVPALRPYNTVVETPLLGLANTMFAPGDLVVFLQKLLLDLLARGVDRRRGVQ